MTQIKTNIRDSINMAYNDALEALQGFLVEDRTIEKTEQAAQLIAALFRDGHKVLICGNGGSCCDGMHFAEEFTGRFRNDRPALPVISLSDPSHITCVGNDYGFENIFSRGVEAYGKPGDLLIGISTSGNSINVINAVQKAKEKKMKTLLFLGKGGGKLRGNGDIELCVNAQTTDRIQEIHMTSLHIIIEGVERLLYPELYQ